MFECEIPIIPADLECDSIRGLRESLPSPSASDVHGSKCGVKGRGGGSLKLSLCVCGCP